VPTVAILTRIYLTSRVVSSFQRMLPVIIAIVESGALYAANMLAVLVLYLCESNGQYPALDIVTPLVVRPSEQSHTMPLMYSHRLPGYRVLPNHLADSIPGVCFQAAHDKWNFLDPF